MKLCVLSIAAGAGLAVTLGSVADAIFFRPLPIAEAERVVRIAGFVSYHDFEDLKRARTIEGMVAQTQVLLAMGREGEGPRRVRLGLAVTGDYFDALRLQAERGRVFHATEERAPVVVLADGFWRAEFGGDASVVGRAIRLGSARFTVVGIAPAGFGLDRFVRESFYIPMRVYEAGILPGSEHALEDRGRRFLTVTGRVAAGATMAQARAEIAGIGARLEREYPESGARAARLLSERESREKGDPPVGPYAWLLAALGAVVLGIASANAAAAMLGRAERRRQEIAVRMALGATPGRLLRRFAGEAMAAALAGAALGLPMAWAATKMLARAALLPTDFPFAMHPQIDARMSMVSGLALAIPAIVCACAPALALRRMEIGAALKRACAPQGAGWGALAAMEIALAGALALVGAALLEGVSAARRIDPGYRVDHVVVMAIDPVQNGYTKAQARVFFDTLLERVRGVRGVRRVALAQSAVLGYTRAPARVECEGEEPGASMPIASTPMWMNAITPEYFALLRLPLEAGRGFDERDTEAGEAVAIVNQELAERCGMGARMRVNGRVRRVVGIARDAKYFDVQERRQPFLYLPFAQNFAARMVLHAQVEGDATQAIAALLRAIHEMDATMPVSEVRPLADSLAQGSMFSARAAANAIGVVGACAIVLALAGVYGTIAQFAARRRREMGIRAALGASRAVLIGWLMRRAVALTAAGVAGGIALGTAAERVLEARIAGIGGAGAEGALAMIAIAGTAMAAGLIPAARDSRISPMVLLPKE